jgi:hypothetical protein
MMNKMKLFLMYRFGRKSLGSESSKRLMKLFNKGAETLEDEFDIITIIRRERSDKMDMEPLDIDEESQTST